jgi:hypothetical protein
MNNMKRIILIAIMQLIAIVAIGQQKADQVQTRTAPVLSNWSTKSVKSITLPSGNAPSFPAWVPDSDKCSALFVVTGTGGGYAKGLYKYSCDSARWLLAAPNLDILSGNLRFTGKDTLDNAVITTLTIQAANLLWQNQNLIPYNRLGPLATYSVIPVVARGAGDSLGVTSVDTLKKYFQNGLAPLSSVGGVPIYAANYPSIDSAINSLYTEHRQSVTLNYNLINTCASSTNWAADAISNDVLTTNGADTSLLITRASSSPTSAGYAGIAYTPSSSVNLGTMDVIDISVKPGSWQQRDLNVMLKVTDGSSKTAYMHGYCHSWLNGQYSTLSFYKNEQDAASSGTFDWTTVSKFEIIFEVKALGWTCYFKNLRASQWANLSYALNDTHKARFNGLTNFYGYVIWDFERGRIRADAACPLISSGGAYAVIYQIGGGTVVMPKGLDTITQQVLYRSNLKLTEPNNSSWLYSNISSITNTYGHSGTSQDMVTNLDSLYSAYNVDISLNVNGQEIENTTQMSGIGIIMNHLNTYTRNVMGAHNIKFHDCAIQDVHRGLTVFTNQNNASMPEGINLTNCAIKNVLNYGWQVMGSDAAVVSNIYVENTRLYPTYTEGSTGGGGNFSWNAHQCVANNVTAVNTAIGFEYVQGAQNCLINGFECDASVTGLRVRDDYLGGSTQLGDQFINGINRLQKTNSNSSGILVFTNSTSYTGTDFEDIGFTNVRTIGGTYSVSQGTVQTPVTIKNIAFTNCTFEQPATGSFNWADGNITGVVLTDCKFNDAPITIGSGTGWVLNSPLMTFNTVNATALTISTSGTVTINNPQITGTGVSGFSGISHSGTTANTLSVFGGYITNCDYAVKINSSETGAIIRDVNMGGNLQTSPVNLNGATITSNSIEGNIGYGTTGSIIYRNAFSRTGISEASVSGLLKVNTSGAPTAATGGSGGDYAMSYSNSATFNGTGSATAFSVTYTSPGYTPSDVKWTPTSSAAAGSFYITSITSTGFTVNYVTAPGSGTSNVTGKYTLIK